MTIAADDERITGQSGSSECQLSRTGHFTSLRRLFASDEVPRGF
jgi:hypothetical protein